VKGASTDYKQLVQMVTTKFLLYTKRTSIGVGRGGFWWQTLETQIQFHSATSVNETINYFNKEINEKLNSKESQKLNGEKVFLLSFFIFVGSGSALFAAQSKNHVSMKKKIRSDRLQRKKCSEDFISITVSSS
jgi:hypothetical protein